MGINASTRTAIDDLNGWCERAMRRSKRQTDRHGGLVPIAEQALLDPTLFDEAWFPTELDHGCAADHWVWQDRFSREQKNAWSHLVWLVEYMTVREGELQLLVLNNLAARRYADQLPAVVDLQERETEEERDHAESFRLLAEAAWAKHMLPGVPQPSTRTSGLASPGLNRIFRRVAGEVADKLLGPNFPVFFFLIRGMKSHIFKPFEASLGRWDEGHPTVRRISVLHGQDESRHIATAHYLASRSTEALKAAPIEHTRLLRLATRAAFPVGRMEGNRQTFWTTVLNHSRVFSNIPAEEREQLLQHVLASHRESFHELHHANRAFIQRSNRKILADCSFSDTAKTAIVDALRADPATASLVDGLDLPWELQRTAS